MQAVPMDVFWSDGQAVGDLHSYDFLDLRVYISYLLNPIRWPARKFTGRKGRVYAFAVGTA